MVVVPLLTPVTKPVDELTVAMDVEADVHVPPPRVQLKGLVEPVHTEGVPVIDEAATVNVFDVVHPVTE